MRKKLLKALERELVSEKTAKLLDKDDLTESEEDDGDNEEEEDEEGGTKVKGDSFILEDEKEKVKRRAKVSLPFNQSRF